MSYQERIEQAHWEEHNLNGFDYRTDYCPRECVADESRGMVGQIAQIWGFVLEGYERDLVRFTYAPENEVALDVDITRLMLGQDIDVSEIADAIERVTDLEWDGDVFRLLPCPMMTTTEESN